MIFAVTWPLLGQELMIHHDVQGDVSLQIFSDQKDVGYRVEVSTDFQDWLGIFNHSVGSQTLSINRDDIASAFYRLNIWQLSEDEIKLVIIGDSTAVDFSVYGNAAGGWGEGIPAQFGPNVVFANLAKPGQSTKTYLESDWQIKNLNWIAPDFVFIQFGMIDELSGQPEKRTTMETYRANLSALVRGFGGTPILVSPITLRKFGEDGKVVPYLDERSDAMLEVAESLNCYSIDLNRLTKQLYNQLGEAGSKGFTHTDHLHLLFPGAKAIAGLVVDHAPEFLQPYRVAE